MEDLRTIALSALIREAASKIGYENIKPKQIEAVLGIFPNFLLKVQDQPFPDILGFPRLRKQWNPLLSIRQALFAYAASVKVLHSAAQLEMRVQVFCRTSLLAHL